MTRLIETIELAPNDEDLMRASLGGLARQLRRVAESEYLQSAIRPGRRSS